MGPQADATLVHIRGHRSNIGLQYIKINDQSRGLQPRCATLYTDQVRIEKFRHRFYARFMLGFPPKTFRDGRQIQACLRCFSF